MAYQIRYQLLAVCAALLAGCDRGPTSIPPAASSSPASPHGNGAVIVGRVVSIEEDGSLVTDIPVRWLAADRTDQNPIPNSLDGLPEGQKLEITIGGRQFAALWTCVGANAVAEGEWCVVSTGGPSDLQNSMLVIVCKKRNAAETAGASVGSRALLAKAGGKF